MKRRASEFVSQLLRPDEEWLVISPIRGLKLEGGGIDIADYQIRKFTIRDVKKLLGMIGLPDRRLLLRNLGRKVCVQARVRAINSHLAAEKGEIHLDQGLSLVRAAVGSDRYCVIPKPDIVVSIGLHNRQIGLSRRRGRNRECNLDNKTQALMLSHLTPMIFFLKGTASEAVSSAILRSIRWFGSAILDKELEDKMVKCFFALETLFVPEKDGTKGDRLAI